MVKAKTVFFCRECGGESVKWYGRCPHCGAWNALVEEKIAPEKPAAPGRSPREIAKPQPIGEVAAASAQRRLLHMPELDRTLGGGITVGSSILLGGEPGIGKSTLLLQAAAAMAEYGPVLYISGEESAAQIRMRGERLGAMQPNLYILAQTDIEEALNQAADMPLSLLIADSVQALYSPALTSAPGSVSQVRAVAAACLALARQKNIPVMLIGHVTKEGLLAGPRVLEHMVDTVLYFEGERYNSLRLLRAVKNRFGSTNELGVFQMEREGLQPLSDPSAYFISNRRPEEPGSAVTCVMQGNRPLLLEIQALVGKSAFGNPRRLAGGYDYNRLLLIIAVLEKKLHLPLGDKDVYVNVAGGARADDPAADLAAAAAIVSSLQDRPLPQDVLLAGEAGLLGELRNIGQTDKRCREGAAFGFRHILLPAGSEGESCGLRLLQAKDLRQALTILDLPV
ncbi:MAG: DNA repair protein RadA [Firmicutes bacterium]|nr:DNA repair protein RadA [Bacillota bacterium]